MKIWLAKSGQANKFEICNTLTTNLQIKNTWVMKWLFLFQQQSDVFSCSIII